MKQFTKKYQLWTFGDSAWHFEEFDTLQECIEAPKYSDWYVTKRVYISVSDSDESLPVAPTYAHPIIPAETEAVPMDEEPVPEEGATLAAYLGGGVAHLTTG